MKTKNKIHKGDLLEITLRIVQESLKDSAQTEIYNNHKIKNSSGRNREFDIVIKTIVNGFELIVAIECKDYKNPVSVEKIEAFYSKCLRVPTINKKIFVASNGYQVDAINAARDFGIECYDIENIEPDTIKTWLAVSMVKPIARYVQIKQSIFWSNPPITDLNINLESFIYHDGNIKGSTIQEFIVGLAKQYEIFPDNLYVKKVGETIDKTSTFSFEADSITGLYFLDANNERYDIYKIHVIIDLIEKEVSSNIKVERIKSGDKEMSTIITYDTEGEETIKLVVKGSDPDSFDPFIVNKNTGEITDYGYTFAIRKKD